MADFDALAPDLNSGSHAFIGSNHTEPSLYLSHPTNTLPNVTNQIISFQ